MNNSPSGDKKSNEKKVNYRIPKVSNLEKRLRHAVSNSTTALTVDLTQDMSNSTSNKARSSFSRADPWRGDKEEMTIFLNFVPKYLARNSKTEAASDILTHSSMERRCRPLGPNASCGRKPCSRRAGSKRTKTRGHGNRSNRRVNGETALVLRGREGR